MTATTPPVGAIEDTTPKKPKSPTGEVIDNLRRSVSGMIGIGLIVAHIIIALL